jgi:hypothetical protein
MGAGICACLLGYLLTSEINIHRDFRADKKFYVPATITAWVLVYFDMRVERGLQDIITSFVAGCESTGAYSFLFFLFFFSFFSF